ncbi:mechanosensitive ion channel family protein [Bacillaceae bacterium SIJ1]|uniref:mechanosensitive ion channel family protein n=1 Tax=Litoribacterium kuwaitense TaxID=1398745 RepID=UPI0013E9ACF3|nr:mechanosensitive ion channel family protein [Litoribacterium kuwaitense]NGP46496.1 mechanosensitive ion channel family protein [Litoribacterium kuwaitense]
MQDVWNGFVEHVVNAPWVDIGVAIVIFFLFLLFRKIFTQYIFKLIVKLSRKTPTDVFTQLLLSFERPFHWLWVIVGTYLAFTYLPYPITNHPFVQHTYVSFLIALVGWGLYRFSSQNATFLQRLAQKTDLDEDSMLIPFVSKVLRFMVIALTIVSIIGEWGIQIGAFIAGLGLGGLAFALAAQETVANFFGGIVIITERPFKKGDWIQTPTVEGTVEDITFRSTKVRTFADALEVVPNATISKEPITNWSEMSMRRVFFTLGVRHRTSRGQLEHCLEDIRQLLRSHDGIVSHNFLVYFDKFTDNSYELYIYYFTKTTVWAEWFAIKEEVNLELMSILENAGVTIAAPIRVLEHNDAPQADAEQELHERKPYKNTNPMPSDGVAKDMDAATGEGDGGGDGQ